MTRSNRYQRQIWGVALTVLTAVSSLLLPVSAQQTVVFQTSDFAGTWRLYAESAVAIPGQAGDAASGTLSFNSDGTINTSAIPAPSVTPLNGSPSTVTGGAFVLTSTGVLTGSFSHLSAGQTRTVMATMTMTSTKDQITGVFTTRDSTGTEARFGYVTLVKVTSTVFTQADLAGTWRTYALNVQLSDGTGSWGYGTSVIDSTGAITNGTITLSNGTVVTLTGGTLSITTDGVITGTVLSTGITRTVTATMVPSKDRIAGVQTLKDSTGTIVRVGLFGLVKDTGSTFLQSDLSGTWRFYGLDIPATVGR